MNNPRVSVYITNFNYGRFVGSAIDSVLRQTLQDFELFVIDDGSTDGSRAVIERYSGHPKVKVVYQQNRGLNVTNNIALRLATGDYIMRLDADDILDPRALEVLAHALDSDPQLGLVFPNYYLVDARDQIVGLVKRHDFASEVTLMDQPAHGACTMIRKAFLDAVGGYDESYSCQDGYELWIKFASHYKVKSLSEALFSYRQHDSNLTQNEGRILQTRIDIHDKFVARNEISVPTTVAVVPVREAVIGGEYLPFLDCGGRTLIERKLDCLLQARRVSHVVVTSTSAALRDYILNKYGATSRLSFVTRPEEFARYNVTLNSTLERVLGTRQISAIAPDAIMTVAIEYPFVTPAMLDDAVNTLAIFSADSLISVRPDSSLFFQHHGQGMVPILDQDKYTKLERESLYRAAGGVMLSRVRGFLEHGRMLHGRVGHIVVDERAALTVTSAFGLEVVRAISSASAGLARSTRHFSEATSNETAL